MNYLHACDRRGNGWTVRGGISYEIQDFWFRKRKGETHAHYENEQRFAYFRESLRRLSKIYTVIEKIRHIVDASKNLDRGYIYRYGFDHVEILTIKVKLYLAGGLLYLISDGLTLYVYFERDCFYWHFNDDIPSLDWEKDGEFERLDRKKVPRTNCVLTDHEMRLLAFDYVLFRLSGHTIDHFASLFNFPFEKTRRFMAGDTGSFPELSRIFAEGI